MNLIALDKILASEKNFETFEENLKKDLEKPNLEKKEFLEFFQKNLWEFSNSYDKFYELRVYNLWKLTVKTENGLKEFFEAVENSKPKKTKGNIIPASEFLDEYFPPVQTIISSWSNKSETIYPRQTSELDLSRESIRRLTKNEDAEISEELDLSDFADLEVLNISRNHRLTQINLTKNYNLKTILANSNPHEYFENGSLECKNNWLMPDSCPLETFMAVGSWSENNNNIYNWIKNKQAYKLNEKTKQKTKTFHNLLYSFVNSWSLYWEIDWTELITDPAERIKTTERSVITAHSNFIFSANGMFRKELILLFTNFEKYASEETFTNNVGIFNRLLEDIGGANCELIWENKPDAPQKFKYTTREGDLILASELFNILRGTKPLLDNPPFSWQKFKTYLERDIQQIITPKTSEISGRTDAFYPFEEAEKIRKKHFKEYFKDLPENEVQKGLDKLKKAIDKTIEEAQINLNSENPAKKFLNWEVKEEKIPYRNRTQTIPVILAKKKLEKVVKDPFGKKVGSEWKVESVTFQELVPFARFKKVVLEEKEWN